MTQDNNNQVTQGQLGPTYLADTADFSSYLQSFNLTAVPEPSTIALGVIGACAFLARRRKK
jgi:catalase